MIGQTISHYKVTDKLGEGGMGVVYLAEDTRLGRKVALKFLPRETTDSEQDRQRFEQEAQAAARLNHPNICTIHSFDEHEERPFLVMEYVEGTTLRERLTKGPLSLGEALDLATQIAEAMAKAHEGGVIHRDVKPGNIMINADGRVKVMDFGLAKLKGADPITQTGSTVGTMAYMAPEQIQGREVDHRADIFAFGVVLFEMVAGIKPFRGEHEAALMYSIVNEEPAAIKTYLPEAAEKLERFFEKALAKEPGERFSSAGEIIRALERLKEEKGLSEASAQPLSDTAATSAVPEEEEPEGAGSSTTISITLPGVDFGEIALGGRRLLIGAAGILLVVLFVGWWFMGDTPEEELAVDKDLVAVFPFTVAGADDLEHLGEHMVESLSRALDGPLHTVDPNALLSRIRAAAPSENSYRDIGHEQAQEIATGFRAGRFILGRIARVGDNIHLSARWYGAEGEALGSEEVTLADEAEIQSGIDELAQATLAEFVSGDADQYIRLAAQTTTSYEAFVAYLEGQAAYRRMDWQSALDHYQHATDEDPEFALAHYGTARSAMWLGESDAGPEAAQHALDLSEVLPDRDRRLIEALHAWVIESRPDEAEDRYREVLQSHPNDVEAWTWLGEVQFHYNGGRGRDVMEAREPLKKADELDPTHQEPLMHLMQLALIERDYARFDSLTTDLERRSLDPTTEAAFRVIRSYVLSSGPDTEIQEQLENAPPFVLLYTTWMLLNGNYIHEAEDVIRMTTHPYRPRVTRAAGHTWIADMHAARGELEAAADELGVVAELDSAAYLTARARLTAVPFHPDENLLDDRSSLIEEIERWDASAVPHREAFLYTMPSNAYPLARRYLLGLLHAAEGDTAAVNDLSTLLKDAGPLHFATMAGPNAGRAIRAEVERLRGSPETALDHLNALELVHRPSYKLFEGVRERFLKAELLADAGFNEEALAWYKTIDGVGFGDVLYMAPAYLGRAQVLEELGRPDEAAESYERFLELWQDADPAFQPEVDEARKWLVQYAAE